MTLINEIKSDLEETTELLTEKDNVSNDIILDCFVATGSDLYWPEHRYCGVRKVDLTASTVDRKYIFNVSNENISSISAVSFARCGQVEFFPNEVLQQFVSLNGLEIQWSFIPVLRDGFFTADFVQIEYLQLLGNRMKVIESEAFKFLTKLKWLDLGQNEIQQITDNIFTNNKRLEFISFHANLIEIVNENLFDDLMQLKYLRLERNECIDEGFGCTENGCYTSLSLLETRHRHCSSNSTRVRDKNKTKCLIQKRNPASRLVFRGSL